jgi:EipB-like
MIFHLVSSAGIVLCVSLASAHAASLAPHRAFYDLDINRVEQGSNVKSIKGRLAYEITGSPCDGYAVSYRIANRILYSEGGSQVIDNHLTSWESGDGLELDVTQKQFVDAKLNSESRIKVKKENANGPGKGEIAATEPRQFETLANAVFPTQYQIRLIDAALKGEPRDSSLVYEGSDDEKSMTAITFIGAKKPVSGVPTGELAALSAFAAWPMSVSYFPAEAKSDDQPQYQANFLMLENGISTELIMDYGTYSLKGKLTKLELLKAEVCQ